MGLGSCGRDGRAYLIDPPQFLATSEFLRRWAAQAVRALPSSWIERASLTIEWPSLVDAYPSLVVEWPSLVVGWPSIVSEYPFPVIGWPSVVVGWLSPVIEWASLAIVWFSLAIDRPSLPIGWPSLVILPKKKRQRNKLPGRAQRSGS